MIVCCYAHSTDTSMLQKGQQSLFLMPGAVLTFGPWPFVPGHPPAIWARRNQHLDTDRRLVVQPSQFKILSRHDDSLGNCR